MAQENDIAILKLKNPINLTEESYCWTSEEFDGPHHQCIRTAKVDLPNNSTESIDGVEAVAAGWGKTIFCRLLRIIQINVANILKF